MALNSAILTRKFPHLCRFTGFSSQNACLPAGGTRSPIRESKDGSYPCLSSSNHRAVFKDWGARKTGAGQLGLDYSRVSAVSDGGSGGNGGFGGSGDGNSGGKGGGTGNNGGESGWSLLSWYLALLAKHPVLTKAVTSALLTCVGDLICQLAIDHAPSLDVKRTFLFTLLGLVLVGPTLHFWYLCLSNLVKLPGASGAILRLLLDQFMFSPIFIGVFLSTLVTLEGKPSQVIPKLRQEWFSAVIANWQLWIPFQFLNFRFVPQQFQVLAANFIALVWNVILSFKAHKEILTK
ncbi:protein sym-1 [Gossypium raimondii]|uniref:Uncharacterized protein n=1 Tax=Gossypium raimondii TaxID=29730 RepID=A0A0D2RRZ4_GOSRA|nr:protein sym-1 [Gossypium raimondii]KJB21900.1 hypothetical protein B456_004G020000 [Gossypium raimondii]